MSRILWLNDLQNWKLNETTPKDISKIMRAERNKNQLVERTFHIFLYLYTHAPFPTFQYEYYWWSTFWEQLLSGAVPELEMKIFSVHCVRFSLAFEWTNKLIYSSVLQASIQKLSQMEALIMSSLPKNQIQIDQRNITAETGTTEIIRGIKIN